MAEDMVERVARAMRERASQPVWNISSLEPVLVGCLGDAWPYLARAAIEAMREPTEAMLECRHSVDNDEYIGVDEKCARELWTGMIDAALSPHKGETE